MCREHRRLLIANNERPVTREPQAYIDNPLHRKRTTAVEQNIKWRAGPVGQKALMPFVANSDQGCARERKFSVEEELCQRQRHPPGAKPRQPERAISEKMTRFADEMMHRFPTGVPDGPEESLEDSP